MTTRNLVTRNGCLHQLCIFSLSQWNKAKEICINRKKLSKENCSENSRAQQFNSSTTNTLLYLSSRKHPHQRCEVRACINRNSTNRKLVKQYFFKKRDPNQLNFTWISQELAVLINCSLLHTATESVSLCYWLQTGAEDELTEAVGAEPHTCSAWSLLLSRQVLWSVLPNDLDTEQIFFPTLLKKAAKAISLCRCLKVFYFKIGI